MKQTLTLVVVLVALCAGRASGQTSTVTLSNLYVTLTQPGDTTLEVEGTEFQNDSSAFANSVQLNVLFNISQPGSLDEIQLGYGTSQGASDVVDMVLHAVTVEGRRYLMYGNVLFPINAGRVHIRRLIPTTVFAGYGFLTVNGTDNSELPVNTLVRNNIR